MPDVATARPRAVFFDMDDTLLDGVNAAQVAWEVVCHGAASTLGCDPDALRQAIRREASTFWRDEALVGHWRVRLDDARELIVRQALEAEGLDAGLARHISLHYANEHRDRLGLFEDAVGTLETLRTAGFKLGLLTNGPASLQRPKIQRFDIARHMDVIVIEGEFGNGKPHPAVFAHATAALGVAPAEAWHVGDNLFADIGGAKAAGLHAVWIHRDRLKRSEDARAQPDRTIAHLAELCAALDC